MWWVLVCCFCATSLLHAHLGTSAAGTVADHWSTCAEIACFLWKAPQKGVNCLVCGTAGGVQHPGKSKSLQESRREDLLKQYFET